MTTTTLMIMTTTAKTIVLIKKEACPEDGLPFVVMWVDSRLPLLLVDGGVAMQIEKKNHVHPAGVIIITFTSDVLTPIFI